MRRLYHPKGFVLVIVLWIVIILILMTTVLGQSSRLSSRLSQSYGRQCACRWAARAAVETAIHVLSEDDTSYDAFSELWHDDPEDFNDIQVGGCTASVEVTDESGKLNVNTADKKHFLNLLEMTAEQANSIIDWRDKDSKVSPEGAEADYYNHLEYWYPVRNGAFETLREVLFVKGIQEDGFYGEDYNLNGKLDANEKDGNQSFPRDNKDAVLNKGIGHFLTSSSCCRNIDALGNARIDISEKNANKLQQELGVSMPQAKWIEKKAKEKLGSIADLIDKNSPKEKDKNDKEGDEPNPLDLETFKSIADKITVSKEKILPGRINVNTAPREVLTAILEGDEQLADEIIAYRDGLETPMTSIAELLDVKSMNIETFKKIAGFITVRSDVFSLYAKATNDSTDLTYTVRAIVWRNGTSCDIIYWYEGIGN
ncbi:MAG: type II secretion system minor pseudopilin [Planctomycetota bacterium]|jgi:type II secretory pathway component PulK